MPTLEKGKKKKKNTEFYQLEKASMTSVLEKHGKLQKMSPEVLAQPHYTGFGTLF